MLAIEDIAELANNMAEADIEHIDIMIVAENGIHVELTAGKPTADEDKN